MIRVRLPLNDDKRLFEPWPSDPAREGTAGGSGAAPRPGNLSQDRQGPPQGGRKA